MIAYLLTASVLAAGLATASFAAAPRPYRITQVRYQTVKVDKIDVFYREAGPKDAPAILLLHGFPTSSRMFRDLIPRLADRYRVIAPDYPGFGRSSSPAPENFAYTFENLTQIVDRFTDTVGLSKYSLYVMDYGAPIGYRLALAHPERISGLIIQNGNAYDEGLRDFWLPIKKYWQDPTAANRDALRGLLKLEATKWQYTNGVADAALLDPDTWTLDQAGLDRKGNDEVQLDLFYDYRTNVPLYSRFQAFFREHQPPTLIVWGKNDAIFPPEGATPYRGDLPKAQVHLLDTGHFALETHGALIADLIRDFMTKQVQK